MIAIGGVKVEVVATLVQSAGGINRALPSHNSNSWPLAQFPATIV